MQLAVLLFDHSGPHPPRTFGLNARKRERAQCSPLVDWPVYPRLRRTMGDSSRSRNVGPARDEIAPRASVSGRLCGSRAPVLASFRLRAHGGRPTSCFRLEGEYPLPVVLHAHNEPAVLRRLVVERLSESPTRV